MCVFLFRPKIGAHDFSILRHGHIFFQWPANQKPTKLQVLEADFQNCLVLGPLNFSISRVGISFMNGRRLIDDFTGWFSGDGKWVFCPKIL